MKVGIKPMLSYSEDFIDLLSSWYTRRWITPTPVTIIPYNTRSTLSTAQQNICFKCRPPFRAIKITEPSLSPLLICAVLTLSFGWDGPACYQISLFHFLIRLITLRCDNGFWVWGAHKRLVILFPLLLLQFTWGSPQHPLGVSLSHQDINVTEITVDN